MQNANIVTNNHTSLGSVDNKQTKVLTSIDLHWFDACGIFNFFWRGGGENFSFQWFVIIVNEIYLHYLFHKLTKYVLYRQNFSFTIIIIAISRDFDHFPSSSDHVINSWSLKRRCKSCIKTPVSIQFRPRFFRPWGSLCVVTHGTFTDQTCMSIPGLFPE